MNLRTVEQLFIWGACLIFFAGFLLIMRLSYNDLKNQKEKMEQQLIQEKAQLDLKLGICSC